MKLETIIAGDEPSFNGIYQIVDDVPEQVSDLIAWQLVTDASERLWFIAHHEEGRDMLWTLDTELDD